MTLTISGDRQTGKTTAMLILAIAEMRAGRTVAYFTPTRGLVADTYCLDGRDRYRRELDLLATALPNARVIETQG